MNVIRNSSRRLPGLQEEDILICLIFLSVSSRAESPRVFHLLVAGVGMLVFLLPAGQLLFHSSLCCACVPRTPLCRRSALAHSSPRHAHVPPCRTQVFCLKYQFSILSFFCCVRDPHCPFSIEISFYIIRTPQADCPISEQSSLDNYSSSMNKSVKFSFFTVLRTWDYVNVKPLAFR